MSIAIHNVDFRYSEEKPTLQSLNLEIADGEFVLLTGQNGAGKSTILKLLNGILKPATGSIIIDGLDTHLTKTSVLASHIAVTFQNPGDQIFASTVRKEILYGPTILRRPNSGALADHALELFHLGEFATRHPYDLSLAHRKLLTLASAVSSDAPILAFDEPTASLSQPERKVLLSAMHELRNLKHTIIVVSHDLDFFVSEASKLVVLNNGRIAHIGKPQDIVRDRRIARYAGLKLPLSLRIQRIGEAAPSHDARVIS